MDRETNYGIKSFLLFLGMITASMLMCMFSIYASVDISCKNDAGKWMPDYPGSEFIEQTYDGIRPFGIGYTQRILYTTDEYSDVRNWYLANDRQLVRDGEVMTGRMGRITRNYRTAPDGGVYIEFSQECSSVMIFW
jgi:hypothetical protein